MPPSIERAAFASLAADDPSGRRRVALAMLEAALSAVDAEAATARAIDRAEEAGHDLRGATVIALGKAAHGMARAAVERCAPKAGLVIGPLQTPVGPLRVRRAEHPASGARAVDNGAALLELADSLGARDTVLCLVSGGGSAMADVPRKGIDGDMLFRTQQVLLASGAPIEVVNEIRRRLSRLKGGGLLAALRPARVVTVLISDVPGLPLELVASGPTLPPRRAPALATLLEPFRLDERLPEAALRVLARDDGASPAAMGDGDSALFVAADNQMARRAAGERARANGLTVSMLPGDLRGEARVAGAEFYSRARASDADVVIWGGETTVSLVGDGRGGRNHEFCLGAVASHDGGLLLSAGTDGVDGSAMAAGAILDDIVMREANRLGLDAPGLLARNDSARFFAATDAQLVTGPTGTNVADVCFFVR